MDKAIIAKKICEKYGIKWDETQMVAHVNGEEVISGMISAAFGMELLVSYDYNIEMSIIDRLAFSQYNMRSTAALVA